MSYSITPEQYKAIRDKYGIQYDRLVRENERYKITSSARSTAWQLEKDGKYPLRKSLGANSCGWSLVELLHWIDNPPVVEKINLSTKRRGFANGSY